MLMEDIEQFRKTNNTARNCDDLVRIHRGFSPARRGASERSRISSAG